MIIPNEVLRKLEASTPPTAAVQERVRTYLGLAQLPLNELARRVGYGANSLSLFMNGRYTTQAGVSATDVRIRRALVEFMDANPMTAADETAGKLYETSNVATMRQWFNRCLDYREMAVLYGPPGAQKTFVLNHLVAEHNLREIPKNGHGTRAHAIYCSEGIKPRDLLRKMARAAGIPGRETVQGTLDNLRFSLSTRKTMFVLDEGQHLPIASLEVVRELNDCTPFCGILIAGSHRLQKLFEQRAVELEQWNSRLSAVVPLPGITVPEAADIIADELGELKPEKVRSLIDLSRVHDGYSKKRTMYISARRLFHQIRDIKSDPRFANSTGGIQ